MKNLFFTFITFILLNSCALDDDDNQILLEYIKLEQAEDMMYPDFNNYRAYRIYEFIIPIKSNNKIEYLYFNK